MIDSLLVFNHSAPGALGTSVPLNADAAVGTVHHITDVNDSVAEALKKFDFEFSINVGGVDSFTILGYFNNETFDRSRPFYALFLIHEVFHRYQFTKFDKLGEVEQDTENYDCSAQNIAMAILEERALKATLELEAGSEDAKNAAKQAVALRINRVAADKRILLDNAQKRGEGTAQWIEHKLDIEGAKRRANNIADGFKVPDANMTGVSEYYGFFRWYVSGAALMSMAEQLQ